MATTATRIEETQTGNNAAVETGVDAGGAYLSDEQILGIEETAGNAGALRETGETQGTADGWDAAGETAGSVANAASPKSEGNTEGTEKNKSGEKTAGKDERNAGTSEIPREFEAIFATGQSGAKLREIYQREAEYRELFPDVGEARALRGAFATIEDARAALEARQELQHVDELFESADPAAHVELMAELAQRDPAAFRSLAATFGERLGEIDPQAYRVIAGEFARRALELGHVPEQIELLTRAAEKGDAGAVKFLAGELAARVASLRNAGADVKPLRARESRRAGTARGTTASSPDTTASPHAGRFVESVNAQVERGVEQAVGGRVGELLPDAPAGTRQKIAGEIYRELDAALKKDRGLLEQVTANLSAAQKAGQFGERERSAMAALVMGKARAMLPAVARRVVGEWTTAMVGASQSRRTKQSAAASRADVGVGGAPRPVSTQPAKVDYAKLSDEEILES